MLSNEEKKAIEYNKKFNVCISDKDLEKAFKNKNLVETLVDKAIKTQYKDNELKVLQKIIEKQSKEIEELENGNKNTFIRGEKILVLQSLLEKE